MNVVHPSTLQVYHINPYHLGPDPVNMDTGDATGDLFFDLKMVLMSPLTCADPHSYFHRDCLNQESNAPDLVVNKLTITVDDSWSGYALCNIGLENNTDQYGQPCEHGKYCCICGDPFAGIISPCNASVGRENVKNRCDWPPAHFCNTSSPDWMCWQTKLTQKLSDLNPGYWYSTLDYGSCSDHPIGPNCTWRAISVDKIINKTCHAGAFFDAVEAHNST